MNDKYLKESIDILNRKFGDPLPTLEDTMKWHNEQKLKELKFGSKAQYDKYKKDHIIKPGTEIEIDGKKSVEKGEAKPNKKVDKQMSKAADDANAKMDAAEKAAKKKKMNFQREGTLMENPVVAAAVAAAMQQQSISNPKTKNKIKLSTAIKSKDSAIAEPAKKKAKSIIQRIKDKFKGKGKEKSEPKKQSKSDADFYKRQFTGEVQEGPDDVRFARRAMSKIAKHEASLRKAMFELEQAFLRDPRPENQKLAKEIKKAYKSNVTGFMKDSVQMIKRMK